MNGKQTGPNQFERNLSNNNKNKGFSHYFKNKYITGALALVLLAGGGVLIKQITKDKDSEDKEVIMENNYPFEKENIAYRDNPQFKSGIIDENPAKGVYLKHDVWLTFYVVQPEDIKKETYQTERWIGKGKKRKKIIETKTRDYLDLEGIRQKLAKLPQFKYLEREEYERKSQDRKTKSFNVPKNIIDASKMEHIQNGRFFIPIPIDSNFRKLSAENFANYCHEGIQEIKNNQKYGSHIKKLLEKMSEKDLIAIMLAFARSETTEEYSTFEQKIGVTELHRREDHMGAFSFTYFHILMEKNADGKTPGPGLQARLNLGLTEGECYHPKNAAKLFLGYRIEKINGNLNKYFPITNENIENVAKKYNGSTSYTGKLKANHGFAQNLLNGGFEKYNNTNLEKKGIEYIGLNSKFRQTYKYEVKENSITVANLKKQLIKDFNDNKDKNCPQIRENNIVRSDGNAISDKIILDQGSSIYILVD